MVMYCDIVSDVACIIYLLCKILVVCVNVMLLFAVLYGSLESLLLVLFNVISPLKLKNVSFTLVILFIL